jgi:hypothetical protein
VKANRCLLAEQKPYSFLGPIDFEYNKTNNGEFSRKKIPSVCRRQYYLSFVTSLFRRFWVTFVSNGAGLDDAEQLANIGYLDWGYGGSQPPLYTWITNIAASVLGTLDADTANRQIRHACKLVPQRVRRNASAGFLARCCIRINAGLFLVPQIGWGITAGTNAFHRRHSRVWLGLSGFRMARAFPSCGLGSRTRNYHDGGHSGKFNASIFVVMLIATGLSVPEYRRILLSKLSLVTIIAFGISFAPTGLWMLAHKSSVIARSAKLQIGASGDLFADRLHGVGSFVEAAFLFSIVALAIAGIIALIHFKRTYISAKTIHTRRNIHASPTGDRYVDRAFWRGCCRRQQH